MPNQLAVFPYPILNELDNFTTPLPQDAAKYYNNSNSDFYNFQVELNVTSDYINNLIANGEAVYLVQVNCPSTFYNFTKKYSTNLFDIRFPKTDVLNNVTISCCVVATKEINNYQSEEFNDIYYKGISFKLDEGDILVMFRSYYLDTRETKIKDAKLGDYVEFREADVPTVSYDLSNIIYITLPKNTYKKYQEVKSVLDLNSAIVHSTLINQALTKALANIDKYPDTTWAKSIAYQLISNDLYKEGRDYNLDQNDNSIIASIPDPWDVATKILQDPFNRLINNMNVYNSNPQS